MRARTGSVDGDEDGLTRDADLEEPIELAEQQGEELLFVCGSPEAEEASAKR